MPKKPIKRGYELWILADKSGYYLKFDIYTGKASTGIVEKNLGARVVNSVTNDLEGKNYLLYFDNYFNSVDLMEDLKSKQIHALGTVQSDCKHLPTFKADKVMTRGEVQWFISDIGF